MSELVQKHLESRAEEMEEMRRIKLYTLEETRAILKKVTEFEYKINGVTKNLQDFKDYIEYEKCLLKQLQCRRDMKQINDRKSAIDYRIRRRIKTLYEIGLQRFPDDFAFWLSYFNFCKDFDNAGSAVLAIQNIIKNFSFKEEVWEVAAKFYAYDRQDVDIALQIIHKALTLHVDSQLLYKQAIEMELLKVANKKDDIEDLDEDVSIYQICSAKIKTYLKVIQEQIKDCKYLLTLLAMLEPYSFTTEVQSFLIDYLITNYSEEDILWHTLAQREMRELHHSCKGETVNFTASSPFLFCIEKYREGLKQVALSKKIQLWSYYLDFLVNYHQNNKGNSTRRSLRILKKALDEASNEGCLSERYYISWLEYLSDEEALTALEKGTNNIPHSVELWKLRLKFAILQNNRTEVNKIFKLGVYAVKEKALPLWLMMLRYSLLAATYEVVEAIYRDGVKQPEQVCQVLKPKYVEWLAITHGADAARKVYLELAQSKPFSKELHTVMLKAEALRLNHNLKAWEETHQLACSQFGKEDINVWLKYVEFQLDFNNDGDVNERVQKVHCEAMSTLSPILRFDFNEKYQTLLSEQ